MFIINIKFLAEIGDFSLIDYDSDGKYLENFRFLPEKSFINLNTKISQFHRLHIGQTPADAEYNFLSYARRLEQYGFDCYEAKVEFIFNFIIYSGWHKSSNHNGR